MGADIKDTYRSVAALSEGLYKDKGSRFLAFAFPVTTEQEVKVRVDALKKEYHDARHHCYAYRIGRNGELWRANDDGEPSGTAGRQILGQIDSAGLSDVLVVVVRYFGGILLGVPGLIKAYKSAAADALASAEKVEKTASCRLWLEFDYALMPRVMKLVKELSLSQSSQSFGQTCSMAVDVRLSVLERFKSAAGDIAGLIVTENV